MGLEEGRAAMESAMGGGPVAPERLNQQTGMAPESAPVINNRTEDVAQTAQAEPEMDNQSLEDLLDLSIINKKIKIGDEVLTTEELKKSLLRHKDYTKKTQELAEKRKSTEEFEKYSKAFKEDLKTLLADPDTYEEQFKQIYPVQFHELYDMIKESRAAQTAHVPTREAAAQMPMQPELKGILDVVARLENRFGTLEQQTRQAQVEKEAARLDSLFTKFHTQYDLGDKTANQKLENLVLSRAQMLQRDPTDQDIAKFFKEEYDSLLNIAKVAGEKQFRAQKSANQQAKDTASGGGTATGSPVAPKTFKEARSAMEAHLSKGF